MLIMTSAKLFLLMKLYLELAKIGKENGEKHEILYNKQFELGKCLGGF